MPGRWSTAASIPATSSSAPAGSTGVTGLASHSVLVRLGIRSPVRRPYTAPETLGGAPARPPADLFALGALTFEWLTGRRPSGLGAEAAAHFDARRHARCGGVTRGRFWRRCWPSSQRHRPGTAMAFAQALAHALDPASAMWTPVFLAPSMAAPAVAGPSVDRSAAAAPIPGSSTAAELSAAAPTPVASGEDASAEVDNPFERAAGRAHEEEPPSEDALRLFATEGTLWQAPRASEDWREGHDPAIPSRLALDVASQEGPDDHRLAGRSDLRRAQCRVASNR